MNLKQTIKSKLIWKDNQIIFVFLQLNNNISINQILKKENFLWGSIFIKFQNENNFYLCGDIYSRDSLNINLEWNKNYFDSIIKIFNNEFNNLNREYKISLLKNENFFNLKISNQILNTGIEINIFNIKLNIINEDAFEKYFNITKDLIDNKEKDLLINELKNEKESLIENMNLLQQKFEKNREELLDKFVIWLNEKKKKIKEIKNK